MNQEKKLTQDEARRVGERFLLSRYHNGMITFDRVVLTTKEASPLYYLEGSIKLPSRSILSQISRSSEKYTFKMQVSALEGTILSWELE